MKNMITVAIFGGFIDQIVVLYHVSEGHILCRSPGLSSPPTRNGTPNDLSQLGDSVQHITMAQPHVTIQSSSSCKTHPSNSIQHTSTQEVCVLSSCDQPDMVCIDVATSLDLRNHTYTYNGYSIV